MDKYWRLVLKYDKLINLRAKYYSSFGIEKDDLIQQGRLGLYKGTKLFDKKYKVRFRFYARICINSYMKELIYNKHKPIRVPKNIQILINNLKNNKIDLTNSQHKQIKSAIKLSNIKRCLESELLYTNKEYVEVPPYIKYIISCLTEREQIIINERFRINNKTFKEIGKIIGVNKQRTQQIYSTAISKIRKVVNNYVQH